MYSDGTHECARLTNRDRKGQTLSFVVGFPVRPDPLLGHPILIGVRDSQRRVGNGVVAGKFCHLGGIGKLEGSQTQAVGRKNWKRFHAR